MNLFFPFQYFILYNISTNLQKSSKNFISAVKRFYPFQRSVVFHLICYADQMTGFYVKCNTGLKFVHPLSVFLLKLIRLYYPAGIYLLKINNRNTRTRCEICSKLSIKTPERRHAFEHVNVKWVI